MLTKREIFDPKAYMTGQPPLLTDAEFSAFSEALKKVFGKYDGDGLWVFIDHLVDFSNDVVAQIKVIPAQFKNKHQFLDTWLSMLVQNLVVNQKAYEKNSDRITYMVSKCIQSNFPKTMKVLLSIPTDFEPINQYFEKCYSPLMAAIAKGKSELIPSLILKTANVNEVYGDALAPTTALSLAVERGDVYAVKQLLAHKDIRITGEVHSKSIFDLMLEPGKEEIRQLITDHVKSKLDISSYDFSSPLKIPVKLLNQKNQDLLKQKLLTKIDELPIFKQNDALKQDFLEFIHNEHELPFPLLNRVGVALECIEYLLNPEWIHQGPVNLCGPASLMQNLVINKPELFLYSAMEMVELPKRGSHLPPIVRQIPPEVSNQSHFLSEFWLRTLRHNYNVVLGYKASSRAEVIYGITYPYQLEKMFADFGYDIVSEDMQIKFSDLTPNLFEKFRRNVLASKFFSLPEPFKIYGKKHKEEHDTQVQLKELTDWFNQNKDSTLTILVDPALVLKAFDIHQTNETKPFLFLFTFSHYININKFEYDEKQNSVSFELYTYGKKIETRMSADSFCKYYYGALMVHPNLEPKLDDGNREAFRAG